MIEPSRLKYLLNRLAIEEAREDFWAYRQRMSPGMKLGWWQCLLCEELQKFYEDWKAGLKPKLVVEAPPQHGKSETAVVFTSWILGKHPELRAIYCSYSEELGEDNNMFLQKIFVSDRFKEIFDLRIEETNRRGIHSGVRNKSNISILNNKGSFRNTTVRGGITGKSLDIGIIDDPIKGREEASSKTIRDKTWRWFTSDFYTRFSEDAAFLTILTRWHVDDPVGRMIDKWGDSIKVFSYPAEAEEDEEYRKKGDALFPQHKSIEFLMERKKLFTNEEWQSLYQQNPQIIGGEIIKTRCFKFYEQLPILKYRVIYADTAQKTKERHDYSVFQCWGYGEDNKIYLIDSIRGKWEAPELTRRAVAFWNKHKAENSRTKGQLREIKVEDKASGTGLVQEIREKAFAPIFGIARHKDKLVRVNDILGQIEAGYVMLPINAPFINDLLNECELFTSDDSHQFDDQVDAMVDAINEMLASNSIAKIWENL